MKFTICSLWFSTAALLGFLPYLCESRISEWKACRRTRSSIWTTVNPLKQLWESVRVRRSPTRFCSPKEICVDGECVCPEGSESDGGRGCVDLDECANDYPCPGTQGVQSYCVDKDYSNHYYKCGCMPGYRAIYSSNYDQSLTGVPAEYRPSDCVETFLLNQIEQKLMISVPTSTNMTGFLEKCKEKKKSLIERLSINVNKDIVLKAKVNVLDGVISQSGKFFAFCFVSSNILSHVILSFH